MKTFAKFAFGALTLAGVATMASAPASAQVSFSIGIGGPGYYAPRAYTYSCDPYSRWYDAYRCGYPARAYYGSPYYGPSYYAQGRFGGGWDDRDGWRDRDGRRDRDDFRGRR